MSNGRKTNYKRYGMKRCGGWEQACALAEPMVAVGGALRYVVGSSSGECTLFTIERREPNSFVAVDKNYGRNRTYGTGKSLASCYQAASKKYHSPISILAEAINCGAFLVLQPKG